MKFNPPQHQYDFKRVFLIIFLLHIFIILSIKFDWINYFYPKKDSEFTVDLGAGTTVDDSQSDEKKSGSLTAQVNSRSQTEEKSEIQSVLSESKSSQSGVNLNSTDSSSHKSTSGASVSAVAYLNNPKPPYPLISLKARQEGHVILRVEVSKDGLVKAIEVAQSSGYKSLDESALQTVQNWKFSPAKNNEVSVAQVIKVPINFTLKNN